jgi:hypothetical protein
MTEGRLLNQKSISVDGKMEDRERLVSEYKIIFRNEG